MPVRIDGLLWTEEAEQHVERHMHAWEIDELVIVGRDFYVFRNASGQPSNHWKVIGRTPAGAFVTAILREPRDHNPMNWEPVTGWYSTGPGKNKYEQERKRLAKKQGRYHG